MDYEAILTQIGTYVLVFGKNAILSVIVWFVGKKLAKWLLKLIEKSLTKGKVEAIVTRFALSILKFALYALIIIVIISIMGIPSTAFVTAFGTVGLTVGLALQGSLSNFAGGVLILLFKPFNVGDYIVACGSEGVVTGIDIFYTRLNTIDNKKVVIPNGTLANTNLTNVTAEKYRRLDIKIGISYDSDIDKAKAVLSDIIDGDRRVLSDKPKDVFVTSLDESQITLETRVWVSGDEYWPLRWDLLEAYKKGFDNAGIEIPFNQLSVMVTEKSAAEEKKS